MNVVQALYSIEKCLEQIAHEGALTEAEFILQNIFQCTRNSLYISHHNILISRDQQELIDVILEKRKRHEPLPYILGKTFFHSKEFLVNRNVLIPRPETEVLVETVLEREKKNDCFFLDIGIGSGAVAASVILKNPRWRCIGIDVSSDALQVAKTNCPGNAFLVASDLFSSIKPGLFFDFIVSNPPYISESEMAGLDESVKNFEPKVALYGGIDGLDFYRKFALMASNYLKPGGALYCEIGFSQGDSVRIIFSTHGWKDITINNDLAGRPRVLRCHF